jgi:hypothetical protein
MIDPSTPRQRLYPIIVIVASLVVFGPLATADFTNWDERFNIWANPRLNPPTLENIAYYWRHSAFGLYIPLTYTVWGVLAHAAYLDQPDQMGARLNPWLFHSANILIHVISALVAYAILHRLVRDRRAACIGALLFALHPVQVEPVAWVAGTKDVLSGMLALIAVWQYALYAQDDPLCAPHAASECAGGASDLQRPRKMQILSGRSTLCPATKARMWHFGVATGAFVLAMLAKPSVMLLPVIVFAIDLLLVRRPLKLILGMLWPWIVLSIGCAILTRINQPAIGVPPAPHWSRPLIALDSIAFYLYKLVWPMQLGIDYGRRPQVIIERGWVWFTWIVPTSLAIAVWVKRRRYPELLAAMVIFVAGVAPVLGLITFLFQYYSTTADHYLYLSMLGVGLAG